MKLYVEFLWIIKSNSTCREYVHNVSKLALLGIYKLPFHSFLVLSPLTYFRLALPAHNLLWLQACSRHHGKHMFVTHNAYRNMPNTCLTEISVCHTTFLTVNTAKSVVNKFSEVETKHVPISTHPLYNHTACFTSVCDSEQMFSAAYGQSKRGTVWNQDSQLS